MKNSIAKRSQLLLVDDHHLVLDGICLLLDKIPEVEVADAVTSGLEAKSLILERDYDIYILDVSIPDFSGFDLISLIRARNPKGRIIVNTMHEEVWTVNRLGTCGVNAVVLKSADTSDLLAAVRCVMAGEFYASERFDGIWRKIRENNIDINERNMALTRRESEILQSVANGLSTKQIAEEHHISDNTVETYRRRLMVKLDAKNSVDLVVKALKLGLVKIEQ